MLEALACLAVSAAAVALDLFLHGRFSSEAFWREYDAAQLRDLEYARAHPGCSLEDAHRERDRVLKRFHRF